MSPLDSNTFEMTPEQLQIARKGLYDTPSADIMGDSSWCLCGDEHPPFHHVHQTTPEATR